ncbi:MAG: methionyl-tRNA formyltransferase [Deltaproteobacteria bacterium]|nr:MAG: methionyl-tRNA formyltransferase [Deltaproteobacteria bacterium]
MGTPDFAVPSLKVLIESEEVVLVVTNPDKPKGRGKKVLPPPVKEVALQAGIPVFQPLRLKGNEEAVREIASYRPDLIVVVAYGKILPPEVLSIPKLFCVNVHASLLPKYRGAAPIQWSLINGETRTGVTIMKMDEGMDTGPILLMREEEIRDDDDAGTLSGRLSLLGAEALREALDLLRRGELVETPQNDSEATYAPMISKEMGEIDWSQPAEKVRNLVRGLSPQPGAFTSFRGKRLKVRRAAVEEMPLDKGLPPGTVADVRKDGIVVACGDGSLLLQVLQPEGKKEMDAWAFAQGYRVSRGECLGR